MPLHPHKCTYTSGRYATPANCNQDSSIPLSGIHGEAERPGIVAACSLPHLSELKHLGPLLMASSHVARWPPPEPDGVDTLDLIRSVAVATFCLARAPCNLGNLSKPAW